MTAPTRPGPEDRPDPLSALVRRIAAQSAPRDAAQGESAPPPAPAAANPDVPAHLRLLGDYELVRKLGEGGFGVVYEARQRSLAGKRVAIKLLPRFLSIDPRRLARFRAEAAAAARIAHPGIVAVLHIGEHEGTHYLVQELVEGGRSIADLILELRRTRELPRDHYRSVAGLFAKVCDALQAAHDAHIVHRDVKPSNLLLTAPGEPKVADFGLAKDLEGLAITASGESPGTPPYMSPEQIGAGLGTLDGRSDVFSLGATLYEVLTLVRPFDGDSAQEIHEKIRQREVADPRELRSGVPPDLALICLKALEKEPRRRYASMRELGEDLRRFLAHEPVRARPPSLARRGLLALKRNPRSSAFAGAVLLVAAMLAGITKWTMDKNEVLAETALDAQTQQALATQRGAELERQLAKDRMRTLELAEQRGDWLAAIEAARSARRDPLVDRPLALLTEARALLASSRREEAAAALRELVSEPGSSRHAPVIALLEADLALAEEHFVTADEIEIPPTLEQGLAGADLHYARALLAPDTTLAARELEQALELDPFHYGASSQMLILRIFQGRLEEALSTAEVFRRMRPSDPAPLAACALALGRLGRTAGSEARLADLERVQGNDARLALQASIALLAVFDQLIQGGMAIGDPAAKSVMDPALRLPLLQSHASSFGALGLTLPSLRKGWAHATQALLLVQRDEMVAARELFHVARQEHTDAYFTLMEASCWTCSHDNSPAQKMEYFREAVRVFGEAIGQGSLVRGVERAARFLRLRCCCELVRVAGEENLKAQVLEDARWFSLLPDVSTYELTTLAEEANNMGDTRLGLRIATEYARRVPSEVEGHRLQARMEYFLGAWAAAKSTAEKVLALDPKHAEARRIVERSVEKALEWAQQHAGPPAPK